MGDLPDWNVPVQTSGMVYRGTLVVAHTAPGPSENTLLFTLGTLDRACLVFVPAYDNSNIVTVVVARQGMPPLQTRNVQIRPAGEVVIAWLSPDVDPGWRVVMSVVGPVTETITTHVFTDTELPVVAVEAGLAPLLVEQNALAGPVSVDVTNRAARLVGVVDTELPGAQSLTDILTNPTTPLVGASLLAFNGVSGQWERVRAFADNTDAQAPGLAGRLLALARLYGYNGATWDRLRSTVAQGLAVDVTRLPPTALAAARVGITTPNPAALTTSTLLAAPGAGLRYRVWRVDVFGHRLNTAGAALDADLLGAAQFGFVHLELRDSVAHAPIELPGGWLAAVNTAVQLQHIATAVSQEVRVNVYYTIE